MCSSTHAFAASPCGCSRTIEPSFRTVKSNAVLVDISLAPLSVKKYREIAIRRDQFPATLAAGLFVWQDVYFVNGRGRCLLLGCCTAISDDDIPIIPRSQISDEDAHLLSLWSAMKRTTVSSIAPTTRKPQSRLGTPSVVELRIAFSRYQRKQPEGGTTSLGKGQGGFLPPTGRIPPTPGGWHRGHFSGSVAGARIERPLLIRFYFIVEPPFANSTEAL